jgi:predicted nucleic acid-binding protein
MNGYLFDTCFLIDLEREKKRGPGKAHHFLQQNASARPYLSWTTVGEFAEGFGDVKHPVCTALVAQFNILPMDEATAHHYAVITRRLRTSNQLIGANDLWIAASALANRLPLVTNNGSHFGRVPGLSVVSY